MTALVILMTQFVVFFLNVSDFLVNVIHQYDGGTTFTCQEVFRERVCDVNGLFPKSCGLGGGSIVAGLVLGVAAQFQASHFTHPTACGLQTTV